MMDENDRIFHLMETIGNSAKIATLLNTIATDIREMYSLRMFLVNICYESYVDIYLS